MADFDGLQGPQRIWSALAIWIALVMAVLDGAIANVALPTIARELGAAPDQSIWVVNGFQLAVVVSLLPLAVLCYHWSFEMRRWKESMYNPYQTSGSDD